MQKSPTCDRLPEAIANIGHDFKLKTLLDGVLQPYI